MAAHSHIISRPSFFPTQVRPPSSPLPSTRQHFPFVPFFPSCNPRKVGLVRTHPYTSRKLISGLLSSSSFARAVNKPGCATRVSIFRALPVSLFRSFLAPATINVARASSSRSVVAFSRAARMALRPTSFNVG